MPTENNEPREEVHDQPHSTREQAFDQLAKGLAKGSISRRDALKWVGAGLVGGLLASIPAVGLVQQNPKAPTDTPKAPTDTPQPPTGTPQPPSSSPESPTSSPQLATS